ncbi:tape measure protein [Acinetobacter baumannii]|uniref:tape measure protein n=1 Tax=Acinetobacter baumannii TaxID=470 RepID=UPI000DE7548E|nr:tape measure protein [Acinetobacter baumannii]TPS36396.1 tape measure protein [Acinetobacter baumannii]SSR44995.1 phage-related minor tail protein [Acinetobacter baumannii]SSR70160.1 phage-related minor tail protein [Acinetobacter baumannii]SSS61152.1 phage-related minor tail protein [Acinetobacter baumannii]SSS82613.1 phage-related minor tail protein [Acinetobacter baumannii]
MTQESRLIITIDSRNAERNARNLGNELDSIEKKGDFASKSMDSLSVATRALAGHMAGLVTVGAAISKMDEYTGLQNRLKLVTTNQVELNKATEDTFRIAQKTYSTWNSVLQVYQRFSDNAKTLNLNMDETARLTETVSKAVAISGASAEAADAALVQFGQALASGTLRGEELNSVMEQTPALAKAIAQGMGITVGQLRSVAAEGKITSKEIVKALKNVQDDVDALFAKTDITIGQSLTLLNNEITKFVGESGKGSGAAHVLADSIQLLASNLKLISDGALVLGIGLVTKAIATKTVAVYADVAATAANVKASKEKVIADAAEAAAAVKTAQAQIANSQATLQVLAAEKALEVERLKAQMNAVGRTQSITRMAELKKIEAQVTRELAAAETALAAAQTKANATKVTALTTLGRLGKGALGLVGGPIGALALGVSALAATYTYFKDKAEEANKKLEEQAKVANRSATELKNLKGQAKTDAINDLTTAFKAQNDELTKMEYRVGAALIDIQNYAQGNAEVARISNEARLGTISYQEALQQLAKVKLPPSLRQALEEQIEKYKDAYDKADKTKTAIKLFGIEVFVAGNKAQNAAIEQQKHADAIQNTKQAADEAQKSLQKMYQDKLWDSQFVEIVMKKGFSESQANDLLKLYKDSLAKGLKSADREALKSLTDTWKSEESIKAMTDARTDSIREQNKELKNQQKVLSVNAKVLANASKFGFSDLESKYELLPGLLSAINMQESKGDANAIGPHTKYGKAKGGFQMLDDTAKRWGLVGKEVFDTGKAAEAAAKYLNFLFKKFGNWDQAISAYHAGEGSVEKGTNIGPVNRQYVKNVKGYVAGYNGFDMKGVSEKDFDSYLNQFLKTQEETEKLRDQYRDKDTLAEKEYLKRIGELKLHFKDAELKQLTDKETARFNAQKELNTEQLEFELNEFRLNEVQKLEKQKQIKLLQIKASTDYSETEKEIRIKAVNTMFDYEISEYRKLQKQKLEEYRKTMYEQASIPQSDVINLLAKKNLTSSQYDSWNLQNQYSDEMQNANDTYSSNVKAVSEDKTIVDEEKRFQALLEAEELFRQQKFAINEKYTLMEQELQKSSRQTEIEIYGQLLSQASSVWGNMTAMVKESAGEQSAAYKAMFLVQQAMAMGTATIQAYQAYSNVLANAPYPLNMTMAPIALGLGMANVGLIAAQTIAGFSDGGYTGNGLKHTPAGIVHKGEVVWSQEDIKRWGGVSVVESMRQSKPSGYANGGYVSNNTSEAIATRREARQFDAINSNQTQSSSSQVPINVYVTVNPDGSSKTDTQNDSKQLGQLIGNAVRTIIRQEQRQGGLLAK